MRKPSSDELRLIEALVTRSSLQLEGDWEERLLVETMNDGRIGSLLLFPDGRISDDRSLGGTVSELRFKDEDGVEVSVTLNLDQAGAMFEVDSWRVDFRPLIRIPDEL
jgi:hypothetical protein